MYITIVIKCCLFEQGHDSIKEAEIKILEFINFTHLKET